MGGQSENNMTDELAAGEYTEPEEEIFEELKRRNQKPNLGVELVKVALLLTFIAVVTVLAITYELL